MPIAPMQSYIRITHTGLQADGVTRNQSALFINDMDMGFDNQNRKTPVYVPVGGSIDVPLSSRVLFSAMQGTIAGFVRTGMLEVETFSYTRDSDNLGGDDGTGVLLNQVVATNVQLSSNVLSFVITAGADTSGFMIGERIEVSGLTGSFVYQNDTYTITNFQKGVDLDGGNPTTALVSVDCTETNIAAESQGTGVVLTLIDGMITHMHRSAGNAGGLGTNVRTYFAGDMVLTGALDPTLISFSPTDMSVAATNSLGVSNLTNELVWVNSDGDEASLAGAPHA